MKRKSRYALWGILITLIISLEISYIYTRVMEVKDSHMSAPPSQNTTRKSNFTEEVSVLVKDPKVSFKSIAHSSSGWKTFHSSSGFQFDYPSELQLNVIQISHEIRMKHRTLIDASPILTINSDGLLRNYDSIRRELQQPEGVHQIEEKPLECTGSLTDNIPAFEYIFGDAFDVIKTYNIITARGEGLSINWIEGIRPNTSYDALEEEISIAKIRKGILSSLRFDKESRPMEVCKKY